MASILFWVTPTDNDPARIADNLHNSKDELRYKALTGALRPKLQLRSPSDLKCLPFTVTTCPSVPPAPVLGIRLSNVAACWKVNSFPELVKSAPPFRLTSTAMLAATGDTGDSHIMVLVEIQRTPRPRTTLDPNLHSSPPLSKPAPTKVTTMLFPMAPYFGSTDWIVGASKYSYSLFSDRLPPTPDTLATTIPADAAPGTTHNTALAFSLCACDLARPNMHLTPISV
jgi:hypothetical protein